MPVISIIVPVYNVKQYIHKCIDSILSQTFTDFELILIDDGSKDGSGDICDDYAKKDNRITVIHKENGGLSSARNAGIDIANGDYYGFVDSDDWIEINMFEYLYKGITDFKAEIALCRILYQFGNKGSYYFNEKISEEEKKFEGDKLLRYLLLNKIDASCCTKLFKSEIFDSIRFHVGRNNEDFKLLYEVFSNITNGIYINEIAYNYVIRNDSITSSNSIFYVYDLYENAKDMLNFIKIKKPNLVLEAESRYFFQLYGTLRHIIKNDRKNEQSDKYEMLKMILIRNKNKILSNKYIKNRLKLLILMLILIPRIQNKIINSIKALRK